MGKRKLQLALAAEKGVDIKKVLQKRQQKESSRRKRRAGLPDTRPSKPAPKLLSDKKPATEPEDGDSEDDDDDWEEADDDEEESDADSAMGGLIDDEAEEGDSDEEDGEETGHNIDFAAFENDESSSESEVEMEEKIERPKKAKSTNPKPTSKADKKQQQKKKQPPADDIDSESEDEEEDDEADSHIDLEDLDDLDDEDREDLVPHTRTTINNHTALLAALSRISLPSGPTVAFATHQSVVSSKPTADAIEDIQDDLQRELAFYAQALEAARIGRDALLKEGVPFARPNDYFAEMVKNDGQMEKVKARLVEEATNKKAAAEARKQRDLKKFGKQVQVAKEQERAKAKRETLEKIKTLKRKRAEGSGAAVGEREDDLFDVAVDNEISGHDKRTAGKRPGGGGGGGGPAAKRQKKDSKYGFGGKKRHSKSGDAVSAGDLSGFSARRMKTGGGGGGGGTKGKGKTTPRLGKSKRKAAAGKR